MTRDNWIGMFVAQLGALGVRGRGDALTDMAAQIHLTQGVRDPVEVAQAEWDMWPPNLVRE